ncbi:lipocalin [Paucibacter sp. KBW04]|uniref:YeeE/YedE family protein n=1 Tax=Paucibacter sp. KBW04 TaxID=2153361 RepID=UPI000F58C977|nr:YeeE/YedE family protein [Paucibacter sp. KBW04]RQO54818.1 lipocalin [Paucibacter sp. KBW04]
MVLETLVDRLGENSSLALGALLIGVVFGFMAQRSRFCLRTAVVEFANNLGGGRLTVWLFAFATALVCTQGLAWWALFDASNARQLASRGSLSGALVGGALFGMGMILARGCSSRLLILAAQGNLRSLMSGLIFAVTAQAALTGALSPLRLAISEWWTIEGGSRDLIQRTGLGHGAAVLFGLLWLLAAIFWARRQRVPSWGWAGAIGVGLTIAAAWWFTYAMSLLAFDSHPIQSLSFTGPSSEVLSRVLFVTDRPVTFDLGLVPGVFIGAFLAAALFGELKLEGFVGGASMRRYIAGAICMGFGGMLAGGCAVGAGLSGAAVFNITSWMTLLSIWASAALTDRLIDQRPGSAVDPVPPAFPSSKAETGSFA